MADKVLRIEAEGKAEADAKVKLAEGKAEELIVERSAAAKALLIDRQAEADALLIEAKSQADAKVVASKAEAESIELQIQALAKASGSTDFIQLKKIEIEKTKAEKWNGDVPQVQTSGITPYMNVSEMVPSLVK